MEYRETMTDGDISALRGYVSKAKSYNGKLIESECKNANHADSGGWTPLLVLAGTTCCLGSALPAGFNIGVMNNAAHHMQSFCNDSIKERYNTQLSRYELDFLWSAIVSVFLIGGVCGSLISSWLSDRFGRKGALYAGNICGILGAILLFLVRAVNSVELFVIGRIFLGLSGGLATSLLPMYMTELAPLRLRGAVGVLCQLGLTIGVLMGQIAGLETILGTAKSWHIMLVSFSPLCAVALLLTTILPESPKYLYIIKGQQGKALKELSRLRNMDITLLQNEIVNLQQELAMKTTFSTWNIKRVLNEPSLRLPLLLVSLLQFGQQLSGINALFYYSNMIFREAGLEITDAQHATIGTGVANILMALVSVPIMLLFSRRKVLLLSCYLCIGCLITLSISIALIHSASFMPLFCIITVLTYVVCYGIGLGPIPFFIGSELFDVGPRPVAMAIGSMFNWGGNFLVGILFPSLQSALGPYVFLIFAGCTLFLALFNKIYLPETRGRNTTDITATITQGFKSRPNATSAV